MGFGRRHVAAHAGLVIIRLGCARERCAGVVLADVEPTYGDVVDRSPPIAAPVARSTPEVYSGDFPLSHFGEASGMKDAAASIRTVDSKGRITLGAADAGRTVQVEPVEDGYVIRFCRVIPEREAWLWENPVALAMVQRGLAEAAAGNLIRDVDLDDLLGVADTVTDDGE